MLIVKSFLHTFADLASMGLLDDNAEELKRLRVASDALRNSMAAGSPIDESDFRRLIADLKRLLAIAVARLAGWIKTNVFRPDSSALPSLDDVQILSRFLRFSEFGEGRCECAPEQLVDATITEWRDLFSDLKQGYVSTGALWQGAEFPFMSVDIRGMMGYKRWLRRLIKHGIRLKNRIF